MLIQKLERGILDLNDGSKKVIKLKKDEICLQGFRIDMDEKIVRGVPHRNKDDCHRFCYADTCDSL